MVPVTGEEPEGPTEVDSTGLDSVGLDSAGVDVAEPDSTVVVPPAGVV